MLELDLHLALPRFVLHVEARLGPGTTAVFGPSGAGKTTLLHLIAGIRRPQRGRVVLHGDVLFDAAAGVNVPVHARRIAMVYQDGRLFPHLSVRGNLVYGMRLAGAEGKAYLTDVVDVLALGPLLGRRVEQMSGGERQRVAIGRALLSSPRLLLMDEPLASLDDGLKRQVLPFLRRVCREAATPILYVSHDPREILQLTETVMVLEHGALVGLGRLGELIDNAAVFKTVAPLGLENVLHATVVEDRSRDGLTVLHVRAAGPAVSDGGLRLFGPPAAGRQAAYLSIRPADIALARQPLEGTSIQNIVPAKVVRITDHGGRAIVHLAAGADLLAEVSHRSVEALDLRDGAAVWLLIKAHAIRYLD